MTTAQKSLPPPKDAKPFKGVGSGVFEIALRYDSEAYRTVVTVQLGRTNYVLHAFQKKSKRGIATAQPDVSHLMNGHFSRFTTDKLLGFLKPLDKKVTIRISQYKPGEPYQEIALTSQAHTRVICPLTTANTSQPTRLTS
jgi:hypothetical protein